ncbi:MAG: bacillithiol system redox-active protein YtxJ [Crocinitomicaceae bacterium]|nr:bacillithiol system redox-active protein YtxJ [Crocinitomicaceae bacterium]
MGWFSKKEEEKKLNWIELTTEQQLEEAINRSSEKPALLFKHSTRCSISSMAFNGFQTRWQGEEGDIDIYYLDLIRFRNVSDKIAELTNVIHQSPQVIVLKNKEVVYTATHSSISAHDALKSIQ